MSGLGVERRGELSRHRTDTQLNAGRRALGPQKGGWGGFASLHIGTFANL